MFRTDPTLFQNRVRIRNLAIKSMFQWSHQGTLVEGRIKKIKDMDIIYSWVCVCERERKKRENYTERTDRNIERERERERKKERWWEKEKQEKENPYSIQIFNSLENWVHMFVNYCYFRQKTKQLSWVDFLL